MTVNTTDPTLAPKTFTDATDGDMAPPHRLTLSGNPMAIVSRRTRRPRMGRFSQTRRCIQSQRFVARSPRTPKEAPPKPEGRKPSAHQPVASARAEFSKRPGSMVGRSFVPVCLLVGE